MGRMQGGPRLVLDHVTGTDEYSDGDVEDDLLAIALSGKDLEDAVRHDDRWAVLYHLHPRRRNLLEWFPFKKGSSLLEIGAGCGALTGMFCEKVDRVTAVELSERRAKIIAARYPKANHLTIFAGRFEDVPAGESHDYVTLIGVLEYAGKYARSTDPYSDLLRKARAALKEGGTLILAIENKLGLKYWAGAPEDHSGKLFQGLEGYPGERGFRTFGREELKELLEGSGFSDIEFFYPHPDYKMPERIFSERLFPDRSNMCDAAPSYDQDRFVLFDEGLACDSILSNNAFPLMANSFLVICRR
ncbi:MAG: class I SAM-dependent methyltransferase [Methanomassiliicoccales archaeon]